MQPATPPLDVAKSRPLNRRPNLKNESWNFIKSFHAFCHTFSFPFPHVCIQPLSLNHLPIPFFYLLNTSVILSLSSFPSPSACFSLPWQKRRLLDADFVLRNVRGKKKSPSDNESAINLLLSHSFVHPLLLSFAIASSMSVLYLCLSISFPSHSNPIFSQGWTCVMALLSPPCRPARPI